MASAFESWPRVFFLFFFSSDIENRQCFPNILAKLVKFILGKKRKIFQKFHNYYVQKTTIYWGKKTSGLDSLPCILSGSIFILKNC
jgi:hypothetical protein